MSTHDIRVQAWGHDPVLVCRTCTTQVEGNTVPAVLARTQAHEGLSFADITVAIEEHTGEGAFRASGYAGEQVEGQTTFGEDPPLVAFGPPDEFPSTHHPRTGQKLPEHLDTSDINDYLRQKGEL